MRLAVALTLVVVAPAGLSAQTSIQEMLLRAKPAVAIVVAEVGAEVTVRCGAGAPVTVTTLPFRESGTGFFISPSGWMITNAHLVTPAHIAPKWLLNHHAEKGVRAACVPDLLARRGLAPGERPDVEDEITRQVLVSALPSAKTVLQPSISVVLPNGARLAAKVVKYSPPVAGAAMAGRDLALLRLEASDMPSLALGDSRRTKIGDRLHIIGFPGVVMTHELLNASAKIEATVTNGAVSGFQQDVAGQPLIQTDASAAAGGSGSPTVGSDGRVIGVLSFVTSDHGSVLQGFNFVLPAAALQEFLEGTGVALDAPSKFNTAWHAALSAYFAGQHARAATHLQEANRLLPEMPDVRRLTADNDERRTSEPFVAWRTVAVAVLVACAAAGAALAVQHWRRNRFRVRPSEVARLVESEHPPLILDVRDTVTYARSPVRLPRSMHVTPETLAQEAPVLDIARDRPIVAYCT
ncbi:MAG TPA: trypsin-like peptidase domain-containing protein [Candidatus Limnocylindria bacterium]|nr:trypsin-like peptidase domain-containing protein [Candidatus Limnocylindria bacterium]